MASKKTGKPVGRPRKYDAAYHDSKAFSLALLGLTVDQMAEVFDIHRDTVFAWQTEFPSFSDSLKRGRDEADAKVVKSLYKRALGYKFEEVSFEKVIPQEESETPIDIDLYKKRVVIKEVVPDTTAQIFWLKNRQPQKWRDKSEVGGTILQYNVEVSKEEVKAIAASLRDEV